MKERLAAPGKRQHDSEKQEKYAKAGPAFLFAAAGEKSERDEEKNMFTPRGQAENALARSNSTPNPSKRKPGKR